MQPDTSSIPHGWLQFVYVSAASILTAAGTLLVDRIVKRRREPAEVRKIDAEAKNLTIAAEIAPVGVTLEILRELRAANQMAETRREEWQRKEDQMRTQIIFWRNKAEEFDGQIIELRYEIAQLETRYNMKKGDLEKALGLLHTKHLSFSQADQPKTD
jgi:predicted Ser/Thr protein kinase